MRTRKHLCWLVLISALFQPGCRPDGQNLSPTPAEDPARYARALRESEAVERANQAAEARFFRQRKAPRMPPTEDMTSSLSSTD